MSGALAAILYYGDDPGPGEVRGMSWKELESLEAWPSTTPALDF